LKKPICIFLILILFLQIGGVLMIYKLELSYAQYNMSIKLESSSATYEVLRMPTIQYKESLIEENEICFNGKMYDIKSVRILSDSIELIAINDVYEEKILEQIKGFIKRLNNSHSEIPVHFKRILLISYIITVASFNFDAPQFVFLNYHHIGTDYLLIMPDTITPPPWLI
jgi:hypothetical protein